MHDTTPTNPESRSVLASLRALVPQRALLFSEALRVAELQANRLHELLRVTDAPIPSGIVSELPRLRIDYCDLPTSGMSYWDGDSWVICLNRAEARTRQRFTLFHEFKHVLDHGRTSQLYRGTAQRDADAQAEQAADYFAGCALMPKRLIKRAWGNGLQQPSALAASFTVSAQAAQVRLTQLGLTEPYVRCTGTTTPRTTPPMPGSYLRQLPAHPPIHLLEGAAA